MAHYRARRHSGSGVELLQRPRDGTPAGPVRVLQDDAASGRGCAAPAERHGRGLGFDQRTRGSANTIRSRRNTRSDTRITAAVWSDTKPRRSSIACWMLRAGVLLIWRAVAVPYS